MKIFVIKNLDKYQTNVSIHSKIQDNKINFIYNQ